MRVVYHEAKDRVSPGYEMGPMRLGKPGMGPTMVGNGSQCPASHGIFYDKNDSNADGNFTVDFFY